ncbi:hypothetical protein [Kitasatospora sp. NPDC093679]|uniref:hypothetical protein n=1 Tax=Kitasatospora sp. NPDC093679 TaxID=3154983 RepID=UPI00341C562C
MANTRIKAPSSARQRTVADVLGALLAGVLLAAILAGIPYGLVRFIGWPLPTSVPTLNDLQQNVGTGTLIDVLAVLVWLLWAQFMVCVIVELRAALSGVDMSVRLPAAGASQLLARKLVTTMLLVGAGALTVGQAASASAAPLQQGPVPQVAALAAAVPGSAAQTGTVQSAPAAAASGPVYTVHASTGSHHETLWDIAERYLGDGKRFGEIFELNKDRVQPDGGRMTDAGLVRAGWQLRLPADAQNVPGTARPTGSAAQAGPAAGQHTVTVEQGDTLSKIAEEELGDGDAYPKLLDATKDVVQPGGRHLTDPDKLFPGDVIVIPDPGSGPAAAAPPTTQAPTAPAPTTEPAPPPAAATPSPAAPSPAAPHTPATAAPTPATATPTPAAAEAPGTPATAPAATKTGDQAQAPVSAQQAVGGIAALLGAGALGVIAFRRRSQQRERRPGETIAMPQETTPIEQILDRTASPAAAELLDRALRTMAAHNTGTLPTVRMARVQADRVEILTDAHESAEPLAPFTDRPDGWWGVRGSRATLLGRDEARDVPAPYPGLATIGTDTDGATMMANLPLHKVLLLDGDEQQVREVARGIAMEAGTALWADHIEVLTAGFGLELQQLLPACRVMYTPSLAAATTDLARVLVEVHQAEHEGGLAPLPWMVVCAGVPSQQDLYAFADTMGKVPAGQPIAAVLPAAGGARELFPDAEVLDASLVTEAQPVEALDGAEVVLQRVTDEAYRQLTAILATAVQPAVPAETPWDGAPDPDHPQVGPAALTKPHPAGSRGHLSLLAAPAVGESGPVAASAKPGDERVPQAAAPGTTAAEDGQQQPEKAAGPDTANAAESGADPRVAMLEARPARRKPQARVSVVREGEVPPGAGPAAPQVQVLGPMRITGIGDAPIAPRLVLLAACLIFKSERDYGAIANHMDPVSPWTPATMDTHMSRLRGRLGRDNTGEPYLRPKPKGVQQYTLSEEVTVDYADFKHLAERGLPHGTAGVLDLEAALAVVRGRPFTGASGHSWAAPLVQTMVGEIVTVANTVAHLRLQDDALDVDAARAAIAAGLGVEPAAEVLYRAWMRTEHRAGNAAGVRDVADQARQMVHAMEFDALQDETEQLIQRLTTGRGAVVRGL